MPMEWQTMDTAPKDNRILWSPFIVNGRWMVVPIGHYKTKTKAIESRVGKWPFRKTVTKQVVDIEGGWRVLCITPDGHMGILANFSPVTPSHWLDWKPPPLAA